MNHIAIKTMIRELPHTGIELCLLILSQFIQVLSAKIDFVKIIWNLISHMNQWSFSFILIAFTLKQERVVGEAFAPSAEGRRFNTRVGQVKDWKIDACCFLG